MTPSTGGRVTSGDGQINCGGARFPGTDCLGTYAWGVKVTLTAAPDPGYTFYEWQAFGEISSQNPLTQSMPPVNVTVTARFTRLPGAPTIGTAVPGNGSASVAFSPPASTGGSPITSYLVTSTPGGFTATGPLSPITVPGLANGTAYSFNVRATNAAGTGPASSASNSVTPFTTPDPPTSARATAGNRQVTVSFTPGFDGGSRVTSWRATANPGGFFATSTAAQPITVTGLTNGTAYSFTVTATNAAGTSAPSPPSTNVTPAAVPGAPSIVATPGVASASVTMTPPVNDGGSPIESYLVRSVPSGFLDDGGDTQVIDRLAPGTSIQFRASARNSAFPSAFSTASNVIVPFATAPGAPGDIVGIAGNGRATIRFSWPVDDGGATVTGFTSACVTDLTTRVSTPKYACTAVEGRNPHACTATVTGLANGIPYACAVRATNAVGAGASSTTALVTPTFLSSPPTDPPTLTLAIAGNAKAVLDFDPPPADSRTGITDYRATCNPGAITASATASPITVTGLANGIDYTCSVAARNASGAGPESNKLVVAPATESAGANRPVAIGTGHNLVVSSTGAVWAWGENNTGKLGNGTKMGSSALVRAGTLTGVTSVAAGFRQSVATKGDGTVWLWGWGTGYCEGYCTTPVQVPGITTAIAAAIGADHVLVLLADGSVRGWGSNFLGQLGDGSFTDRPTLVTVAIGGVVAIAAGYDFSFALKADGTVWAWGAGTRGQLGTGDTAPDTCYQRDPYLFGLWDLPCSAAPVQVGALTGIVSLVAGGRHALALKSDGTVWAWGSGRFGQLGRGTMADGYTPVAVPGLADIVQIAAGFNHSLALRSDGTVYAWGLGHLGALGVLATDTCPASSKYHCQRSPKAVSLLKGSARIYAGGAHTIAVQPNGAIAAIGFNNSGQLGYGTTTGGLTRISTIDPGTPALITGASGTSTGIGTPSTAGGINLDSLGDGVPFPSQAVGTSSTPIAIRFNNLLEFGTVDVTGVSIAGAFSQSNDCGSALPAGESCTINVIFSPIAAGETTGELTVTTNLADSPSATLALHGVGLVPPAITSANGATFTVGVPGTFTVSATGTPPAGLQRSGTLPEGIGFNAATGVLSGTPTAAGVFPQTFTATNGVAPNATQSFTLTVNAGTQSIAFGVLADRLLGAAPFAVSATATSGLAVAFASTTASTCTVAGNTVTLIAVGTCTIVASQPGDANFLPASPVPQPFAVLQPAPATFSPSPASLDFGGQSMNTTSPALSVTFTNSGASPIAVSSVTASTWFGVTHNCAMLDAGASCTANVTFTPTAEGSLNGTLTAQTGLGTVAVPLSGVGERSLVTHYYRAILRRAPDAGGKAFWESEKVRLPALGANVNETWYAMATFFFFSSEYTSFNRDDAGFVTDLYNTFFNRSPDGGGLGFWTGQLAQGMPREVVLVSFMFSNEFRTFTQAIFGNIAARKEVDTVVDFYRGLLSRLPDDGGFASWVGQFRAAQCQGAGSVYSTVEAISSGFANGGEYAARNRTNAQYVGDLYNAFLRRGGDLGGVQFWINEIATGARTRAKVRQDFIASPEFTSRVNAIIAEGCVP